MKILPPFEGKRLRYNVVSTGNSERDHERAEYKLRKDLNTNFNDYCTTQCPRLKVEFAQDLMRMQTIAQASCGTSCRQMTCSELPVSRPTSVLPSPFSASSVIETITMAEKIRLDINLNHDSFITTSVSGTPGTSFGSGTSTAITWEDLMQAADKLQEGGRDIRIPVEPYEVQPEDIYGEDFGSFA